MRMPTLRAVAPLAALLLAGCADGGSGGPSAQACDLEPVLCDPGHYLATHPCVAGDVRPRVYAPDTPGPDAEADPWRQGDFWTYRLVVDGADHGSVKLVYYDDADVVGGQAQHYLVGSPDRAHALEHALFSINPMLGRIHRALYSPHESGDHADMFNFPLCEGNRWATRFYGTDFRMEAHRASDVGVPGAAADPLGFAVEGTAADGSRLRLGYSPEAKWFTRLELEKADGTSVRMALAAVGTGASGRHEFLRAQQDEAVNLGAQTEGTVAILREDGREGPYDKVGIALDLRRTAGTGRVEVHLRDPSGASRACVGVAGSGLGGAPTACPSGPLVAETPYEAGTWTVTIERPLLGQVAIEGEARLASIYDRGGTV